MIGYTTGVNSMLGIGLKQIYAGKNKLNLLHDQ